MLALLPLRQLLVSCSHKTPQIISQWFYNTHYFHSCFGFTCSTFYVSSKYFVAFLSAMTKSQFFLSTWFHWVSHISMIQILRVLLELGVTHQAAQDKNHMLSNETLTSQYKKVTDNTSYKPCKSRQEDMSLDMRDSCCHPSPFVVYTTTFRVQRPWLHYIDAINYPRTYCSKNTWALLSSPLWCHCPYNTHRAQN